MKKCLKIFFVFVLVVLISGCGSKTKNNEDIDIEAVLNAKADSLSGLKMPNNYDVYNIKEASEQSWFSKVGRLGETKHVGATNSGYDQIKALFGSVSENEEYMIPDAIIIQGKANDGYYHQVMFKKEDFALSDGYAFYKNMLKLAGWDDEKIDNAIKSKFGLTDEQYKNYAELIKDNSLSSASADNWHYYPMEKFMPINIYNGMLESNYHYGLSVVFKQGEIPRIIAYYFTIDGGINENYKIYLVYDELKANILITANKDTDVYYSGEYNFESGIIDEDAFEFFKANVDTLV